jgi:hypothetical protein
VNGAVTVEFYYKLLPSATPVYLGSALSDGDQWNFDWDTTKTPNGNVLFYARIKNSYGEYDSKEISINVSNEIAQNSEEKNKLAQNISEATKQIAAKEQETVSKQEEAGAAIMASAQKVVEEAGNAGEARKKADEGKKDIESAIGQFVDNVKKENALANSFQNQQEEKSQIEEKISNAQDELKDISRILEKGDANLDQSQLESAKRLQEAKKASLESYTAEKEKIDLNIKSTQEQLSAVKNEKEKTKEQVLQVNRDIVGAAEKAASPDSAPTLAEMKAEAEKTVGSNLQNLETAVVSSEKAKEEQSQVLNKDSDGDGLSDAEEIRLKTDPLNPDSDGDGYLDKTEYALGYNPLDPSPADKIIYGDPRSADVKSSENFTVESAQILPSDGEQKGLKIQGKGLSNSFVTVYIYSTPVVMVTKTDENGNWSVTLDKDLSDGNHEVYVALTNNFGAITDKSEAFTFTKMGNNVAAITLSSLSGQANGGPVAMLQNNMIVLVIVIIVLAVIISLAIIGFFSRRKISRQQD